MGVRATRWGSCEGGYIGGHWREQKEKPCRKGQGKSRFRVVPVLKSRFRVVPVLKLLKTNAVTVS